MNPTAQASSSRSVISRKVLLISLTVVVLVVSATTVWLFQVRPDQRSSVAPEAQPTPTPFPTPTPLPVATGKQKYNISSKGNGIRVTSAEFDPLDARVGQEQTINIKVSNTAPIDSVNVIFMGDSATESVPLSLTSGTNRDGIWSKTWTFNLAHAKIYSANITVVSGKSTDSVDLWFR